MLHAPPLFVPASPNQLVARLTRMPLPLARKHCCIARSRPSLRSFVRSSSTNTMSVGTITGNGKGKGRERVAIIGSGNWGSAIARIAGYNAARHSHVFEEQVPMWVHEEQVDGRNLSEIINERHENVKYLPGIKLPTNVRAIPSLIDAARSATMLVFCLPHQFIPVICHQLKESGTLSSEAKAISLIKGVDVKGDQIKIFPDVIEEELGVSCSALSGANIADEVADEKFSETTVGYEHLDEGLLWQQLFHTDYFHVQIIEDKAGVALCGALKNIVAIAAGFSDGLGFGNNGKAAIMRIGLLEMKRFSMEFFHGVKAETFVQESAGIADLITTCFGGRNRRCAEAFAKTGKPFAELEQEMLNGQKLQGVATAGEVHHFLKARGKVDDYPLFRAVYDISHNGLPVSKLTNRL